MNEQILAVQRMQDYIEKNRSEAISLSGLARASLFSPWYAYRLFRACLGLTPAEYIRKYRLTQAAKQLRNGETKVIDAAYDAGFSNVDTFTRAFYREFGLNPSDYMKRPVPVAFFIPYGAKYRELRKENIDVSNIQPIFVQAVRKPERLCIIKRGKCAEDYFPYCEEVSCDVWGILMSMQSLCGEPVSMWLPPKYKKPGTSTYVQGVEVAPGTRESFRRVLKPFICPKRNICNFKGSPSPRKTIVRPSAPCRQQWTNMTRQRLAIAGTMKTRASSWSRAASAVISNCERSGDFQNERCHLCRRTDEILCRENRG